MSVAAVQFNFSTSVVEISEGDDLPSLLSIIKTGEHQGNINIQVMVTPVTPNENGMCHSVGVLYDWIHNP